MKNSGTIVKDISELNDGKMYTIKRCDINMQN